MASTHKPVSVSEARKRFGRLVRNVSRGGPPVTITQHGKEQAALLGIRELQELHRKSQAIDRSRKRDRPFTLKGSLKLCGSAEQLVVELARIRTLWVEAIERSSQELVRDLSRK